ncbi:uncharacterized protein BDZ99DRAFT_495017 [Mytilinidion resinicola]|uniref:Uncharacterized protein n=1 Tax=Mytilinidion resinicola TaxID=574789 RepID=A0A6A6Z2G7_9PEZI|nr:uncharacterized protein BDZ99DRAFT_495017 [Mytilinidion resinicola]KAF2815190.1 hypothetical protein BDZ99DRAFT_495017 [Mytilinidion resinicola]
MSLSDALSLAYQRYTETQEYQMWQESPLTRWTGSPPWADPFAKAVDDREALIEGFPHLERSINRDFRYDWGDFEALSYTWGIQASRRKCCLNGSIIEVPANLEEALHALCALEERE